MCACSVESRPAPVPAPVAPAAVPLQVAAGPVLEEVPRIGVNLGLWTWWGAEQLGANVIQNPGFEGLIDRALVAVAEVGTFWFTDDRRELARPDGFWAGAVYHVRTGPAAGRSGAVADSRARGRGGLPEFNLAEPVPGLAPGDVVALTRIDDGSPPSHWWMDSTAASLVRPAVGQTRPGSPGHRSVVLRPPAGATVELVSYLDAIGDRAGKLLPVRGEWRLVLWARGSGDLHVEFGRHGSPPFVRQDVAPDRTWSRHEFRFAAADTGADGILSLHLRASRGPVWLDDVDLRAAADSGAAFRHQVVTALHRLRPGFLRDWAGQLGDTLPNRLASPWARRASRYRPGGRGEIYYLYSLPEFLGLCDRVDADPWIVMPTTFDDGECSRLGQFLATAQAAHGFGEILLEFGNENWNELFRPAGIPDPRAHGEAASRAFRLVRGAAGRGVPLRCVVNGQSSAPERALEVARRAEVADIIAVAPYLLHQLDDGLPLPAALERLFAEDGAPLGELVRGLGSSGLEAAVYEVNLHTTRGTATGAQRDRLTAGAAGGTALARRLLAAYGLGIGRQCVYTLAGFDTRLDAVEGTTRLWGLVRDLGPTGRLRSTGLAVQLLNRAAGGALHPIDAAAGVEAVAFLREDGWSAVAVSTGPAAQRVELRFPAGTTAPLPGEAWLLDAVGPGAHNEETATVAIVPAEVAADGTTVTFGLPPWGLAVLLPGQEES